MPNRIDSHRIGAMIPMGFTALCAILAVVALPNGSTRAANDCSAAPNSQPPEGSHWYYRIEGAKQRHCWYLGPEGQRVRHAEPAAKSVAPARAGSAGDRPMASAQAEPPLPPLRPNTATDANARTFVQDIEQRSRQETLSIAQWPDAPRPDRRQRASAGRHQHASRRRLGEQGGTACRRRCGERRDDNADAGTSAGRRRAGHRRNFPARDIQGCGCEAAANLRSARSRQTKRQPRARTNACGFCRIAPEGPRTPSR